MNSQKLSGAVSCLAAILILAADKIFAPVCKGTMELANGGECMMRCHYYGITLFLFGLLLLAESVLLFFRTAVIMMTTGNLKSCVPKKRRTDSASRSRPKRNSVIP